MQFKIGQYDINLSYEIESETDDVDNTTTQFISSYSYEILHKGKIATNVSRQDANVIAQEVEEKLEEILDGCEA